MKELEKTKRISISSVLFLLVIVIGLLTFKQPQYVFDKNSASTLERIVKHDYVLSKTDLKKLSVSEYQLVDLRSNYEYEKGHLSTSINIPTQAVIDDDNMAFFNRMSENNKTLILYGEHPNNANSVWMFLYQMGYENVKILSVETLFFNNRFQIKNVQIEKPLVHYAQIMKGSRIEKKEVQSPKKKIFIRKKKKHAAEGGC